MFEDRTDAGEQLATDVEAHDVHADVVLAVPRGGLPVGRAVADRLGVPLDVVVARKLGAPGRPELAIGAVASSGTVWRNDPLIADLGVDEDAIEATIDRERDAAREKVSRYRSGRPPLDLDGKTVLVADDGIATGATTIACIRQVRAAGAARVVLAVPVGPPSTIARLQSEADDVTAVETPPHFSAVGQFYADFRQVPDEEASAYLD